MRNYINSTKKIPSLTQKDIAIVYNQPKLYATIQSKKVYITQSGKITKENFFQQTPLTLQQHRYIVFRMFLINSNARTFVHTYDLTRRQKQEITKIYQQMTYDLKSSIYNLTSEKLQEVVPSLEKELQHHFFEYAAILKGKRFVKLYPEALEFLWNISGSLFKIYLCENFSTPLLYEKTLNSYRFYFCGNYIKRYGFDQDDFRQDYRLKTKTVFLIFKAFEENMLKLHNMKKGDIDYSIQHELKELSCM